MRIFTLSWLFWTILLLNQPALPGIGLILAVSALAVIVAVRWSFLRSFSAGYFVACFTLALALIQVESRQLNAQEISSDLRLRVKVASVPHASDWGTRFTARVVSCRSCIDEFGPRWVQLSSYGHDLDIRAGEEWEFTVRLKPYRGLRNAGSFDRTQWALYKGVDARGYVRKNPVAQKLDSGTTYSLAAMRESLALHLAAVETSNNRASLIQALVLGIKNDIPQDVWSVLRDTGTSHLVAISGLHISLLAAWAYFVSTRLLPRLLLMLPQSFASIKRIDVHTLSVLVCILIASGYAMLAGFELPVQRALTMLMVWAVAALRFRHLAPASGLAIAMLAVLAGNVLSVLSPGLWLSFGTVAVLFYLHRGRVLSHREIENDNTIATLFKRSLTNIGAGLQTHIYLGVVLLPITAWFFQSGSLIAPIANLLAVPWVGFIVVPLCFIAVLLSAISISAAQLAVSAAQSSIEALLAYLQFLSERDWSAVTISVPSAVALLFSLLGLLLIFSPKGLGLKKYAVLLFLPLLSFNAKPARVDGFDVHILDVGQGLASLVFTPNHTLLFDTGGKLSGSLSMLEAVVVPYLHAQGRRKIDHLVVSHSDEDHVFGLDDVLGRFPDIRVHAGGDVLLNKELNADACRAGDTWMLDDVRFSVLNPAAEETGSDNDRSCVLLIHLGASRALLTGDIERRGEFLLNSRLNLQYSAAKSAFPVNLVIAPHHGSHTSSSSELIKTLNPEHVVFAAGHRNRYGFPHVDVQLRYKLMGARQYITGTLGSIVFSFGRVGLLQPPKTWWQTHRRFWHGFVNPACSEKFSEHVTVIKQLLLAQKGQSLCGK